MITKKEGIIEEALLLFSKYGYHNTGVDKIRDQANVSKMTMYKYFPTKDILIENVLLHRHQIFIENLESEIDQSIGCITKIKAIFYWHKRWFNQSEFYGCMFIKASDEFPDYDSNIRRASRDHKTYIKNMLQAILEDGKIHSSSSMSEFIAIVLDGMIVNANMFRTDKDVEIAWKYVQVIISDQDSKV